MASMKYKRAEERPSTALAMKDSATLEVGPLLGTWANTNSATRGIAKLVLSMKDGKFIGRFFGVCDPSPCDWGEVAVRAYAKDVTSSEAVSISASYNFDFMETHLQAHLEQGVLVVSKFDRFRDGSGRSNCFSREFFYRADL